MWGTHAVTWGGPELPKQGAGFALTACECWGGGVGMRWEQSGACGGSRDAPSLLLSSPRIQQRRG